MVPESAVDEVQNQGTVAMLEEVDEPKMRAIASSLLFPREIRPLNSHVTEISTHHARWVACIASPPNKLAMTREGWWGWEARCVQ